MSPVTPKDNETTGPTLNNLAWGWSSHSKGERGARPSGVDAGSGRSRPSRSGRVRVPVASYAHRADGCRVLLEKVPDPRHDSH